MEGRGNYSKTNHCKRKMKFSFKDFFSKCDQICSFPVDLAIFTEEILTENFIFCAVNCT